MALAVALPTAITSVRRWLTESVTFWRSQNFWLAALSVSVAFSSFANYRALQAREGRRFLDGQPALVQTLQTLAQTVGAHDPAPAVSVFHGPGEEQAQLAIDLTSTFERAGWRVDFTGVSSSTRAYRDLPRGGVVEIRGSTASVSEVARVLREYGLKTDEQPQAAQPKAHLRITIGFQR